MARRDPLAPSSQEKQRGGGGQRQQDIAGQRQENVKRKAVEARVGRKCLPCPGQIIGGELGGEQPGRIKEEIICRPAGRCQ